VAETFNWKPWSKANNGDGPNAALDLAAQWLGDFGFLLPDDAPDAWADVPGDDGCSRWAFRFDSGIKSVALLVWIDVDVDSDGTRFVDRSRCVRCEVRRG
jgi:hypothetical protein